MPVLLLWLALFGIVLVVAANFLSRFALRVATVVTLAVGVLVLAHAGQGVEKSDGKPFREVVLVGAQEAGEDLTELLGLEGVPLDAAAGVAVILLLVYAYRRAEIANSRRVPGPVEVRPFTQSKVDGDATNGAVADGLAMEARMRQRLADANVLPPPSVPGGSDQKQLVEVMQKSPLVDVGGFGKILAFLTRAAFPDVGYHVNGTLISETETGGCGITVSLNNSVTSSTVAVRTFVAQTYEQAVDSAAFFVAQNLLRHCTTLPEWQQWWDCVGLEAYQRGRQAVREEDWEEAGKAFAEAGIASPNNVHPLLEQAAVCELRDYHHEALVSYFTVLKRLPRLIEARYRLAAAYANAEAWDPRLFTERERRANLHRVVEEDLRRRWGGPAPPGQASRHDNPLRDGTNGDQPGPEIVDRFHELARRELDSIERDLRLWRFLLWRARSAHRCMMRPEDAILLSSPPVIRGPRRAMLATVRTAKLSLELKQRRLQARKGPQTAAASPEPLEKAEARITAAMEKVLECRAGWQAYYNAACFYSTRMSEPPETTDLAAWEEENDGLAECGVKHLGHAFLDPGSEFSPRPAWILDARHGDHDLDNLRRHRRFQDWQMEMRFDKVQPGPEQAERDQLNLAWYRLGKVAGALSEEKVWDELQRRLQSAADVRPVVTEWCQRERGLWQRLAAVGRRPQELSRWAAFEESARQTQPALCGVDLSVGGPRRSDWHDPLTTAAEHRASWRSLAKTAAGVVPVWEERAQSASESSTDDVRCQLELWIEEARGLWECVARSSRRPLNPTLAQELSTTAGELAARVTVRSTTYPSADAT
jgi:hypothetical protein